MHLLIAAAGSGRRMGASGNKLLLDVAGRPVLAWTLDAALRCEAISWVGLVGQPIDAAAIAAITARPACTAAAQRASSSGSTRQRAPS